MSFSLSQSLGTAASSLALAIAASSMPANAQQPVQSLPELKVEQRRAESAPARARRPATAPRRATLQPRALATPSAPVQAAAPAAEPLVGGRPAEKTTAGPVRGYQALTSVSATKTDLPIQNIPQSVQVLPRKVLDDQGVTSQSEALLNISGVQPLNPVTFGQLSAKVRGFSAERVVDGLPNYYDAGARDLTVNVERIEVLKGPQGVLYSGGANAQSGVVNIVSKLPTASRSAEFGITAGANRYWSPYFDINQPLTKDGTALFRLTGQYEGARSDIDVINRRSFTLNPTLTLTNNAGTALTLQGHFSRRDQQDYSGLPAVGTLDRSMFSIRRDLFPGDPDIPKTRSELASLTAKFDHTFNSVWSTSTIARVSRSSFNEPSQGLTSNTPLFGSQFEVYDLSIRERMREISLNTSLTGKFDHGWIRNTLLFAADFNRVTEQGGMWGDGCSQMAAAFGMCAADTTVVDYTNPVFSRYQGQSFPFILANNRYTTLGATAQVQSTIAGRLHIVAGGRLAQIKVHDDDGTGYRAFLTGSPVANTTRTKPLPRLGVSLDVVKGIALFAGYSEGMKPVAFYLGADPMKPEEIRQVEGGLKLSTGFGLSATLAAFNVTRRNVPVSDAFGMTYQTGVQRSQGFEADVIYQPSANWSFLGSYAHTDIAVMKDRKPSLVGATPTGVPRDSGRFWANYVVTDGALKGLALGGGLYAASEQSVELGKPWKTPGYVTLDARIAYQYRNWTLALVGKNLADRQYLTPYGYLGGRVAPGSGRAAHATASARF